MKPTKSQLLFHSKKENLTMGQISEIYDVSRSTIFNLYKKYFIKSKTTGGQKRYFANDNFFAKWSHEMAYCLGFITADGHIWKNRPFITIGISKKDEYILKYIRDHISPQTKLRYYTNSNKTKMVQMCIHSEKIHKDLQKLGVKHDKTFNLELDFNIPNKYWGDYLRGYFDGDGSIWKTSFYDRSKEYYYANFVCASEKFLVSIRNRLGFGRIRKIKKKYFELNFCQTDCLKLMDTMYKNTDCFKLNRKYERFLCINITYNRWTKEEDKILMLYNDKKDLLKKLSRRTWGAIKARKNAFRKNCKNN